VGGAATLGVGGAWRRVGRGLLLEERAGRRERMRDAHQQSTPSQTPLSSRQVPSQRMLQPQLTTHRASARGTAPAASAPDHGPCPAASKPTQAAPHPAAGPPPTSRPHRAGAPAAVPPAPPLTPCFACCGWTGGMRGRSAARRRRRRRCRPRRGCSCRRIRSSGARRLVAMMRRSLAGCRGRPCCGRSWAGKGCCCWC